MTHILYIILFICSSIAAGFIIHVLLLRSWKKKSTGAENPADENNPANPDYQDRILFQLISKENLFSGDISYTLGRITESASMIMNCERVSIWVYNDDYSIIRCLDLYTRSKSSHRSGDELASSEFPSYINAHKTGLLIAASDVFTDNRTKEIPFSYLKENEIVSLLDSPVWRNNRITGVISFEHTGKRRFWTRDEERLSILLASIVSLCFEAEEKSITEKELHETETQLRTVGDNLAGGLIYRLVQAKNGSKKFTFISAGVKEIHGLTPEEVMNDSVTLYSQIYSEDSHMLMMKEKDSLERMAAFEAEIRIISTNGNMKWIRLTSYPTLMKNGDVVYDGIEIDITERKLSEMKLRKSEENYRNIIDNIQDVFYRTDITGDLIMVSPSVTALLGFDSHDECIGMNLARDFYLDPSERDKLLDIMEKNGSVTDYETFLRRKDGSVAAVSTSSHFFYDDDGNIAGVEGLVRDITVRKTAEDMFNKAFHENPCPMSITAVETGLAIEVNKAWLNTMEYKREDIVGITPSQINLYRNPDDRLRIVESIKRDGRVSGLEVDFVSRTGKIRNGVFFAELIEVSGSKMLLTAMLDISGQKTAEQKLKNLNEELLASNEEFEALNDELIIANSDLESAQNKIRESEREYRSLVETLSAGIIVYDSDGRIIYVNPAAANQIGFSADIPIGKSGLNPGWTVWGEDGAPLKTEDQPLIRVMTTRNPVKDLVAGIWNQVLNDKQWLLCSAYPEFDTSGKIIKIVMTFIDITARKKAEEQINTLKNYLSSIIDSNPDMIIGIDTDFKITFVNRNTEKTTGIPMEKAIGLPFNQLLGNFAPWIESMRGDILEDHVAEIPAVTFNNNEGKRYYDLALYPLAAGGIEGAVVKISDITDLKKKDDQLNQALKMDAIGQLAGGVAHDFNNMLGGIMGAAEIIHMYTGQPEKIEKYIQLIKSTAERASDLTAKLLAFSRKSEVELVPVDIHRIISETAELLKRTIDRRISIDLEMKASRSVINGDMSQLMNIFLNMGINSGHAMPGGGILKFSTDNTELDNIYCRTNLPDITPGKYVIVEVSDTGCGIPQEDIARIFDPFFTTKDKSKGTGLGLSAAYGNVKQHHGAITVYSEPGLGTRFSVYFPLADKDITPSEIHDEIIKGHGLILIVDDEEMMRITAKEILSYIGYDTIEAVNGKEGLEVFMKEHKKISAVLLDMVMPVMNGRECFIEMKKTDPDVKVIISSGFLMDDSIDEIKKLGLDGFIKKPYQTLELSRVLAKVLSAGQ